MGRKKANAGPKEDLRPFCFFCERKFDDVRTLLQHQRAKHFKCPDCDDGGGLGKCESVQGLIVHTLKIHSRALDRVPNAMQGRDNPELNVYGMEGIPLEMLRDKGYHKEVSSQPIVKDFVEPPPANPQPQPEAFNPSALLSLPGFTPPPGSSMGSSMLGAPGLPGPPGMPSTLMLGMPGLPAPPGMMVPPDAATKPTGLLDLKDGLPGLPGMPNMLPGMPPFPMASAQKTEADSQEVRGTKRTFEESPPLEAEDMSVEELRAQLDRYSPNTWARCAGS